MTTISLRGDEKDDGVPQNLKDELKDMFDNIQAIKGPCYARCVSDLQNMLITGFSVDRIARNLAVMQLDQIQNTLKESKKSGEADMQELVVLMAQAKRINDLAEILDQLKQESIQCIQKLAVTFAGLRGNDPFTEDLSLADESLVDKGKELWDDALAICKKQTEYLEKKT